MIVLRLRIPSKEWEGFKKKVLNKSFQSETATLTRHIPGIGFENASFKSEYKRDIEYVVGITPENGEAYF